MKSMNWISPFARSLASLKNKNLFDNDMHLNEEAVALYIDALKLNKVDLLPDDLLEHISVCLECKKAIMEILPFVENQRSVAEDSHPFFGKRIRSMEKKFSIIYRIAAVIIIGISISLLFYVFRLLRNGEVTMHDSEKIANTIGQEQKGNTLTEKVERGDVVAVNSFAISHNLEDLVNAELRSPSVTILTPANNSIPKGPILFSWQRGEAGPLTLKILSNTEKILYSSKTEKSRLLLKEKLHPGLYYWKLESKDELLYVGKFLVKR